MTEPQTFHFRAIRHGRSVTGIEWDTLGEAVSEARNEFDGGHSCQQEIWSGDECVMDHAEFMKVV